MDGYLIWWLDQAAAELAVAFGAENAPWPKYLRSEFNGRCGRAGRGRLWCPAEFNFPDLDWKGDSARYKAVGRDCGGIVIKASDVSHVIAWPGFVTDRDLNLVEISNYGAA